jgi:hypothetical protein
MMFRFRPAGTHALRIVDIDVLSSLMQEYHALTRSLNESPRLSSHVPLQALNAQVLMELMGKLAPAFVAACQALHG